MKRFALSLILVLLVLLTLVWWRLQAVPLVSVASAVEGTAVNAVTGRVEVFAELDLKVKTEREGRLNELLVEVGERVKKGQLLAVQDSRELQLRLEEERVRLEAARQRLELPQPRSFDIATLEQEVEAIRTEVEFGQVPRSRLEGLERELAKQRAWLAAEKIENAQQAGVLEARVAQLEHEAGKMQIAAPFEGEVVEIYVSEGTQMDPNADVLRLVSAQRLVEMELNEEDMGGAALGQRVTLRLASHGDREFSGEVSRLGATADAATKTRKLFVQVDAPPALLVPGLTGEGYLVKDERASAVLIPRRALRGERVWVLRHGSVEPREVQPGFLSLRQAEILEGLEPGELVVLEDQDRLRSGQSVRQR